ncbi:hypothetical protein ES706_03596 [subsurface metagenome]
MRREDEGIVIGVARLAVIARSESDEAISRLPRSFQSLAMTFVDYPFILRVLRGRDSYRSRSVV